MLRPIQTTPFYGHPDIKTTIQRNLPTNYLIALYGPINVLSNYYHYIFIKLQKGPLERHAPKLTVTFYTLNKWEIDCSTK